MFTCAFATEESREDCALFADTVRLVEVVKLLKIAVVFAEFVDAVWIVPAFDVEIAEIGVVTEYVMFPKT